MFRFIIRHMIKKFGKRYDYEVDYILHMLEVAPDVMNAFNALSKLSSYRKKAPVNALMAARLLGVLEEDCGPCVQLSSDMAREAGMAPEQVEAVLTGDQEAMSSDTALGYRYAVAILNGSPDQFAAREAVRQAHGEAAVVELTLAMQVNRLFPMIKQGLGYGKSCSRVRIGNRKVLAVKAAA